MCMQALAWKLLRELEDEGIGTNEVKMESLRRSWQREAKKGYKYGVKEFEDSEAYERNEEYVRGLLNLRAKQAKEDWESARKDYRELRKKLEEGSRESQSYNFIRNQIKRTVKHYIEIYETGRKQHREKVRRLILKYRKKPKKRKKKEKSRDRRKEWITDIAEGTGRQRIYDRTVPKYGNPPLDDDEEAAMQLPPKFCTFGRIEEKDSRYDRALCQTKLRWGRMTRGSPKEQEEEAQASAEGVQRTLEEKMDDDIVENSSREVFDRDRRILDFRKLRVTDMKNNPRVQLPSPRPPAEEAVMGAKEMLWSEVTDKYSKVKCNSKGEQLVTNLTKAQKRGIAKLKVREKRGEIVINTTDKSGKLSISTRDNYRLQGAPHVQGDKPVTWK